MLPRDARPEDAPVPCACCGAKAETCVWQFDLCHGCHGRWHAEVVAPSCHGELAYQTPKKERVAQWERVTAEWLQRAKARAA